MTESLIRGGATLVTALLVSCEGDLPRLWNGRIHRVILSDSESVPCSIEFEPTGVSLRSNVAGTVPDPSFPVALGPDGSFYTSTFRSGGGRIAKWSEAGEFLGTIGRPGEGPGELGPLPHAEVDAKGIVHVFDMGRDRWQRFRADGQLLSLVRSPVFGVTSDALVVLNPDSVLSSEPIGETQFHIYDAAGNLANAFGKRGPGPGDHRRPIVAIEDSTFWAAPRQGDEQAYVLEEWSLDGFLIRQVVRDGPWWSDAMETRESDEPVPTFQLYAGTHGHLVVIVRVRWPRPVSEGESWVEVIDPAVPEVIASNRFVTRHGANVPYIWNIFPGTRLGIVERTDGAMGLPVIDIMRYHLEPKTDISPAITRPERCSS